MYREEQPRGPSEANIVIWNIRREFQGQERIYSYQNVKYGSSTLGRNVVLDIQRKGIGNSDVKLYHILVNQFMWIHL